MFGAVRFLLIGQRRGFLPSALRSRVGGMGQRVRRHSGGLAGVGTTQGVAVRVVALLVALSSVCAGCDGAALGGSDALADSRAGTDGTPTVPAYLAFDYERLRSVHRTSADAALAFLDGLSPTQRAEAVLPFGDPRRSNWSNLPPGLFNDHNGVRLGDLNETQAEALHRFLATALSADGYATTMAVVGAEDQLAANSLLGDWYWSSGNYWLAFFGEPTNAVPAATAADADSAPATPAADKPWGWQFGGHHLAINMTVVGGRSHLSPTFVGIEPARYTTGEGTVAPLAEHRAAGLALFNALDETQRRQALADRRPRELLTGAGKDGFIPSIDGVAVSGWNAALQGQLVDLVRLWVRMMPANSAAQRLAEVREDLGQTHFTWHGETDGEHPIYYRVQGPRLIVEFSTQDVGDGGHQHTIYRNPANEYGSAATR